MSRWKGDRKEYQREAVISRRSHCPLSWEKIEEMFEEFKQNPSVSHLVRKFGVKREIVIQAIDDGWPGSGIKGFSERIRSINIRLQEVSDYNEVTLRKRAIQNIMNLEEKIYDALGGRELSSLGIDETSFNNLTPRELKDVSTTLVGLEETKIRIASSIGGEKANKLEQGKSDSARLDKLLERAKKEEDVIEVG